MPPSAIRIRSSSSNSRAKLAKSTAVKYAPNNIKLLITHYFFNTTCIHTGIYISENACTWSIKLIRCADLGGGCWGSAARTAGLLADTKTITYSKHNRWPTSAHLLVKYAVHQNSDYSHTLLQLNNYFGIWGGERVDRSQHPGRVPVRPGNETTTPPPELEWGLE